MGMRAHAPEQVYTTKLYTYIEEESGQASGVVVTNPSNCLRPTTTLTGLQYTTK